MRNDLKRELNELYGSGRPRLCLACGKPFSVFDMHEGIVSRGDVQGWKRNKRHLIMVEVNCIPLHHDCNINHPPSRQAVWDYQVEYYGDAVRDWYYGLPWKAGPPRRFE